MTGDPVGPLIVATGLERTYPGPPPVEALRSSTFQIDIGDNIAVLGPSGSGKSTLMNLLGLLDRPSAGEYVLMDTSTADLSEGERSGLRSALIGFVFQAFHLQQGRTATENVENGLLYHGIAKRERRARAIETLERVGMGSRMHAEVSLLSGGERQRVAIARAIVHKPRLLLADEPTGNLDSDTGDQVLDLLSELRSDGLTQIVVTHDPNVADAADRRIAVKDGWLTEIV